MRSIKAIFTKQITDMFKNWGVLLQFVIYPAVAFIMTELIAKQNEDIDDGMFVSMMAPIFAGMGLVISTAGIIAEDMETGSLRFLMLAGVKPYEYLIGIGSVVLLFGTVTSGLFALTGGFTGMDLVKFLVIMISGVASSIILGATIGILSKNQQSAASMSMPVAMVLGFTPMIAVFNETAKKIFGGLYTQQINTIINDFSAGLTVPVLIILANIAVLTVLFALAYKKKGLKG